MSELEKFLAECELFVLKDGRAYNIRRQDIPQLLELLEAYKKAFAEMFAHLAKK